MGKEEVDLVTVADKSSNKKPLLERYNIPIEHLSYEYISQCTQVKELERMILILRSGEEGAYPDLTRHAEERLTVLKPGSTVLRKATPVVTRDSLEPERRQILENDMSEWMNEMKLREKDLEEGRSMQIKEPIPQPAIREITVDQQKKKQKSSQNPEKSQRINSFDYAAWDKYDADTELNRIDLKHEQKQAELKRNQQKLRAKEETIKKASRESIVNKLTLTGTEYNVMAEEERKKGNEAFKAGDYDEALQFYNLSIAIDATPQTYNNRAITFIKLRRYSDAIKDCNRVISVEHKNIKALLRRGLALEHMEKNSQALADYEVVLKTEPTNKLAIAAVNKLRGPCNSRKIAMKIEEETGETANSTIVKRNDNPRPAKSKISQEKIQKISHGVESPKVVDKSKASSCGSYSEAARQIIPQLCFCNNAPSSSQQTSPLPHMRDVYCLEKPGKSQKLPKLQSIFTDTKKSSEKSSGVYIEEIPNEQYEKSSGVIIEEIPNDPYDKSSGVIIEEIPNEQYEKSSEVTIEEIPKEPYEKSAGVTIEEIPKEPYEKSAGVTIKEIPKGSDEKSAQKSCVLKSADKLTEMRKRNALLGSGDNLGNIVKSNGKLVEEIPPKEIHRQQEMMEDLTFDKISSPYEFVKLWHSFKNDSELVLRSRLLLSLTPEDIDTVIGNKMDGDMFTIILRCFERHFCVPEHSIRLQSFLQSLTRIKRFSLICMFMDEKDKIVLRKVFTFLEGHDPEGIQCLRKAYDLM